MKNMKKLNLLALSMLLATSISTYANQPVLAANQAVSTDNQNDINQKHNESIDQIAQLNSQIDSLRTTNDAQYQLHNMTNNSLNNLNNVNKMQNEMHLQTSKDMGVLNKNVAQLNNNHMALSDSHDALNKQHNSLNNDVYFVIAPGLSIVAEILSSLPNLSGEQQKSLSRVKKNMLAMSSNDILGYQTK